MTQQMAARAPLDPFKVVVGVLIHPVTTMGQIAAVRPWLLALIVNVIISLAGALATMVGPPTTSSVPTPTTGRSEWVAGFSRAAANYAALAALRQDLLLFL